MIVMKLEDVKRDYSPERRTVRINIRITNSQDSFVQENNLSFTKIFDEALKQLGYKEPTLKYLKKENSSYLKDSYRDKVRYSKRILRQKRL
jgi:hypothetical protein